jgi:hypothetical protein
MKKNIITSMIALSVMFTLFSCKNDTYDGLTIVDPVPAVAITFPQSMQSNGSPMIDQNAFIVQNPIGGGQISLDIQVPQGKTIQSIKSVRGQRARGTYSATQVGGFIRLSPLAAASSPATFNRLIAPNFGTNITTGVTIAGNKATWVLPFSSPLIPVPANLGPIAVDNFFRFYVEVELTDGTTHLSQEVRVWITR